MYTLLVVDDDMFFRTSLISIIEQTELPINQVFVAGDGQEAIDFLNQKKIDIVITDMSMPNVDGVQLIRYIKQVFNHIKFIVLSGFDDFLYVKESIQLGAIDYLLKHSLTVESLHNIFKKIQEEFKRPSELEQIKKNMELLTPRLKYDFIRELIVGDIQDETVIKEFMEDAQNNLSFSSYAVIALKIDDYFIIQEKFDSLKAISNFQKNFLAICQQTIDTFGCGIICHVQEGDFAAAISLGNIHSELELYNILNEYVSRLRACLKRFMNITCCFGIGKISNNYMNMHAQYLDAVKRLQNTFYGGKDKVITSVSTSIPMVIHPGLSMELESKILKYVYKGDALALEEEFDHLFSEIMTNKYSAQSVQMLAIELINLINKICREADITKDKIFEEDIQPHIKVYQYQTYGDLHKWLSDIFKKVTHYMYKVLDNDYCEITKKALAYIDNHFGESISLNEVAGYLNINSAYLSRVFKKDIQKGLTEYLNHYRIIKAQELIRGSNIKVVDIYKEVGFSSYNYFFKVFKEVTGMTPVEYKNNKL
ncbi:response regulator transcription factor [Cellulosilyticum sp. I15G10I2]|uniref:response regulator transcription factor n=1 Tax=Cellulosilyticum sp. I15G10I2 TaxID=1892843 RepID=UPI00085BC95D|nr:response regulator [Cellulosilyticum sp. I15G10I2]